MKVVVGLLCIVVVVTGVRMELASTGTRCVFDNLETDELAVGEFWIEGETARVNVVVHGPRGKEVYSSRDKTAGKFGFTADKAGDYKVCFENRDMVDHLVTLKFRSGVEAKDLSAVVQKDQLKPMHAEIMRIEETLVDIRTHLLNMKYRESEMRDLNEKINFRVSSFSLFSVVVVATLGVWQILYLRSYFAEKKII